MKADTVVNSSPRLAGLDFLRFLAASVVICSHAHNFGDAGALFNSTQGTLGRLLMSWEASGWVAVDLFFVLSGFLVSGLLFEEAKRTGRVSVSRFLVRRGFKIYPGFWVMTAVFVVWDRLQGVPDGPKGVLAELFYLQNYGIYIWGHTWSLAVEEHFYFLLAGLFFILKRRTAPGRTLDFGWIPNFFLAFAVACLVARVIVWWAILDVNNAQLCLFIHADYAVMDSLMFGVLLSHYWHNCWDQQIKQKVLAWRVPLAVVGVSLLSPVVQGVMGLEWYRMFGFVLVYLGAGCLVLGSLSLDGASCPAWIRWPACLGKYSYSVYLWHVLTGMWMTPLLGFKGDNLPARFLNTMIYFTSCWVIGIILARLVEFPALRWRDRLFPSLARFAKTQPPMASSPLLPR
jgi:peptidoglycan/LPS O-acetylase OafA/YrhL